MWVNKKQTIVSRSTIEVQLRALRQGVMGGMWVKRILDDLKVPFSSPIKVVCDNKSVIFSALDLIQHGRMKHVDIDRHFIKEKIDSGIICYL